MEQSLFVQWVAKFFSGIVLRATSTLNDTKTALVYLHMTMLKEDYSPTGKWESVNTVNSLVVADVVAMDSPLPLKKRDSISKATGDIPKMGMRLQLNERQLTDLDILVAQGASDAQIAAKLFADTPKAIGGIHERIEEMFLMGLSSGVALIDDPENVGAGVRIDYGYLTANKFGSTVVWANAATAMPFDDIQRVLNKAAADGNTITRAMMDQTAFNSLAASKQAKDFFAFSQGFTGSTTPIPSLSQMNTFVSDRYGFTIQLVTRSIRYEKNGVQVAKKPWQDGAVVFLTSDQVGSMVYATLAEENHKVANVTYEKSGSFILVSKYRKNEPSLAEFTASQARVLPVIVNVDQIYTLDTKTAQG